MTDEVERLYYKIGEVAEMIDVENTSLIRFWESELDLRGPHRSRKGDRRYTVPEIAFLRTIREASRDLHLTTIKRLLKEGGEERLQEVVDSLKRKEDDLVQ